MASPTDRTDRNLYRETSEEVLRANEADLSRWIAEAKEQLEECEEQRRALLDKISVLEMKIGCYSGTLALVLACLREKP